MDRAGEGDCVGDASFVGAGESDNLGDTGGDASGVANVTVPLFR